MNLQTSATPELLARGSLARTSLHDVMSMIGVSRQPLCLVLEARGTEVGRVVVKAGQLLGARATPDREGQDALGALLQEDLTAFQVFRASLSDDVQPLGELAESWSRVPPVPATAAPPLQRLFRGRLDDVPLADLLAVLSVSRQTLGVAFFREGVPTGTWVTRAGQVLDAELASDPQCPADEAFQALMRDPGDRFSVVELAGWGIDARTPLGTFFELTPGSEPTPARELLGSGPAAGSTLGDVLVARGRGARRLVLRREGRPLGEIRFANGEVSLAHSRDGARGRAAFATLATRWSEPGVTWEVYRAEPFEGRPLGTLVELLAEIEPDEASEEAPEEARRLFGATFDRISLEDLVAVLSVSRRRLGVMLSRGRRPLGGWVVKSGQVLDAVLLGHQLPAAEAFEILKRDPGTRFTVMEVPGPLESEQAVGVLEGLWQGTEPPSPRPVAAGSRPDRDEVLLEGSLHDVPLFSLLMALGLSRQQLLVEVLVGRVRLGAITLRSSQVLEAEHSSGFQRSDAFFRLLTSPIADRFRLVRQAGREPADYVPLGTLDEVLRGVRDALDSSGPRLVVPGEPEMRAWLDGEPHVDLPSLDDEPPTDHVERLKRRLSDTQLVLVMQAATIVMLIAVTLLVILLAVTDVL